MCEQPNLFSPPAQSHSETSIAAAEQIRPRQTTLQQRVWNFIDAYGPVTDEQISNGLDLNPSTVRPRRIELLNADRIRCSDRDGITESGRRANRWVTK